MRRREGGVHVEAIGAQLRDREGGLDEPAVVSTHDRDPVALADAAGGEAAGDRVGAAVDLGERECAGLVLDHRLVGVVDRRGGDAGGGRSAPAGQHAEHLREPVGTDRADHPSLGKHLDVEGNLAERAEGPQLDAAADVVQGTGHDLGGQLAS